MATFFQRYVDDSAYRSSAAEMLQQLDHAEREYFLTILLPLLKKLDSGEIELEDFRNRTREMFEAELAALTSKDGSAAKKKERKPAREPVGA